MNRESRVLSTHWADITADKIIRERGEKDTYVCASGITPSGTVHIGNFREIISVELVVRALKQRGKNVRFIYSWDDYDVFRKVPQNMPQQELLETFLRKPITLVPDVLGNEKSYAAHNEKSLEKILPVVGIEPEYIYQAERYRASEYAEGIRTALEHRTVIRRQLDAHRTSPLAEDWYPASVFCTKCDRDTTKVTGWDGEYGISYSCDSCGNSETVDLRSTAAVKLPWRIDWPMRWSVEGVDFEPAGKDHHSEGGSFDTAKLTGKEVFGHEPPVTFQYDFVRIKGGSGKISSSSGEVVSLADVLRFYQPEVVRYLFAGTRPNSEFAISFDLDVLKVYEDYDKIERNYFNRPENPKKLKKWEKDARIYELSQVGSVPERLPYQIQIRHLTTLLQIHSGDIDAVIAYLGDIPEADLERFRVRAACAWNWVNDFAPEDFRFALRKPEDGKAELTDNLAAAVGDLGKLAADRLGDIPEKEFSNLMYDVIHPHELESGDFFTAVYQALIGKDKGPRLLNFLHVLGKDVVSNLLGKY
jgi:lysyl-tRNA synthetase class 1